VQQNTYSFLYVKRKELPADMGGRLKCIEGAVSRTDGSNWFTRLRTARRFCYNPYLKTYSLIFICYLQGTDDDSA
jgi:hypothetical protein